MKADFEFKDKYNFNDLVEIIKILRAPGGCPWDAEQTHTSIRENFLEETYEALEAIDTGNKELLKEELGDVLLQVVLHADISRTDGDFDIDDRRNFKKAHNTPPPRFRRRYGRLYRRRFKELGRY